MVRPTSNKVYMVIQLLKVKKPDIKYENYLDKYNKRDLVSLIKKNEDWSSSSKESIYFMIARWLLVNVPNSTFVTMFQELGYSLKMQRDEAEGDNELDDKEKKYFREHSFLLIC